MRVVNSVAKLFLPFEMLHVTLCLIPSVRRCFPLQHEQTRKKFMILLTFTAGRELIRGLLLLVPSTVLLRRFVHLTVNLYTRSSSEARIHVRID